MGVPSLATKWGEWGGGGRKTLSYELSVGFSCICSRQELRHHFLKRASQLSTTGAAKLLLTHVQLDVNALSKDISRWRGSIMFVPYRSVAYMAAYISALVVSVCLCSSATLLYLAGH